MPLEEKAKFVSLWPRRFPALPPAWRLTCPLLASPLPLPLEGSPPDHKGLMPVPLLSPTGLGSLPVMSLQLTSSTQSTGQTDIRQADMLTDLTAMQRATTKEESLSRRRQNGKM